MWTRIGVCADLNCDERLWHAGLSVDRRLCFVAGFEEHAYIVWEIDRSEVVWREDSYEVQGEYPTLDEWVDESGCISIVDGPAKGRYRIFGLNFHHEKTVDLVRCCELEVDVRREVVTVVDQKSRAVIAELKYEASSGDWAFASFSEDGNIIAVVEPYYVTFFGWSND